MATTQGQEVSTVSIKGKPYVTVAERVKVASSDEYEYEMVSSDTFEVAGRIVVTVAIKVKGKRYVGTSEAKLDAPKNTADGEAPIECAETSALGRALGFAGIGVIDGIASADEVMRVQQRGSGDSAKPAPKSGPKNSNYAPDPSKGISEAQINLLVKNGATRAEVEGLNQAEASAAIDAMKANGWKFVRPNGKAPSSTVTPDDFEEEVNF